MAQGPRRGSWKLVSLLGMSSGTTHTALCLLEARGYRFASITIYATSRSIAEEAARILSSCPCPGGRKPSYRPKPRIVLLPFQDIRSLDDLVELRRILSKELGENTIVDVTGGRKLMAVAAVLEALSRGGLVASAIISQEEYERLAKGGELCSRVPREAHLIVF